MPDKKKAGATNCTFVYKIWYNHLALHFDKVTIDWSIFHPGLSTQEIFPRCPFWLGELFDTCNSASPGPIRSKMSHLQTFEFKFVLFPGAIRRCVSFTPTSPIDLIVHDALHLVRKFKQQNICERAHLTTVPHFLASRLHYLQNTEHPLLSRSVMSRVGLVRNPIGCEAFCN